MTFPRPQRPMQAALQSLKNPAYAVGAGGLRGPGKLGGSSESLEGTVPQRRKENRRDQGSMSPISMSPRPAPTMAMSLLCRMKERVSE